MTGVIVLAAILSLPAVAPGGGRQAAAGKPSPDAALVEELRRLPDPTGFDTRTVNPWSDFLRKVRESPDGKLLVISRAMITTDASLQRNAALAISMLALGRTADGKQARRVDVAPILKDLTFALAQLPAARIPAAAAIGTLGPWGAPATRALASLLFDEDEVLRRTAADALGEIGVRAAEALPDLQRMRNQSTGPTQDAADRALTKVWGPGRASADHPPGGILLLPGYTHVVEQGIDTRVGVIARPRGPHISYDIGSDAGDKAAAILENRDQFTWTKVEWLNGHRARLTMQAGGRLTVTFEDFANFEVSSIRTPEDMADVLLMLGTYSPSKH